MVILLIFSFLAGIVTILSPCILPVLPIVLSGSVGEGRRRPFGIVLGFVLSFTFFTLFLASIVKLTGISADFLRLMSVAVIFVFGVSLLIPAVQNFSEKLFSFLTSKVPQTQNSKGFLGGVIVGLSLGLIWTPCVGPIIASVITLAVTSSISFGVALITFFYALGTAIPMLIIMLTGRAIFQKVPWLIPNASKIQKVFGVLMIITAIGLLFNLDRKLQTEVLDKFPQYGAGLTRIEDNELVKDQLLKLGGFGRIGGEIKDLKTVRDEMLNQAPEIIPGGEWFNSKPVKLSDLKGKVVLIDFWTYTCINCIRTLPYLKDWDKKYRDKGLVIIGVHTPEFEFEKNPENVAKAIADFGLKYPIVQDNNFATWRAYNNRYWPAKYFIDKNGVIRSSHFGEGAYDESEKLIQELLEETGQDVSNIKIANPEYKISSQTPETYLGYLRMEGLASPEIVRQDQKATYSVPNELAANNFAFVGEWVVGRERSIASKGAKLYFNFGSKDVFLVMRTIDGKPGQVKVSLDGKVVKIVDVKEDKLYELIKLKEAGRHLLELEFLTPNVESYAFTFG